MSNTNKMQLARPHTMPPPLIGQQEVRKMASSIY
ncbi:hypothetical protein NC653_003006 [Populus alba x Populus x berolinensis]|uniref:Uncharacterized protein n=1 Tax=Populus alba x Populus x berolinensis TaxID=444605 RepID=A0AAD6RQA6_9ROSI|nr:hypothetical protein NC653_003006 [Populus alba x Populus x berolinensis]